MCRYGITGIMGHPSMVMDILRTAGGKRQSPSIKLVFVGEHLTPYLGRLVSFWKWVFICVPCSVRSVVWTQVVRRVGPVARYHHCLCLSHGSYAPSGGPRPAWQYG